MSACWMSGCLLGWGLDCDRKRKVMVCAHTPVARLFRSFLWPPSRPFLLSCRVNIIMSIDRVLVKSAGPNRDISLGLECCGTRGLNNADTTHDIVSDAIGPARIPWLRGLRCASKWEEKDLQFVRGSERKALHP